MNESLTAAPWWTTAIVALMVGGGWTAVQGAVRAWRQDRSTAGLRSHQIVDASILTVARARDELAEDLTAMREILREERAERRAEREVWDRERERFHARITELEQTLERERAQAREGYEQLELKMHQEREAADRRYADLLTQVRSLRERAEQPREM